MTKGGRAIIPKPKKTYCTKNKVRRCGKRIFQKRRWGDPYGAIEWILRLGGVAGVLRRRRHVSGKHGPPRASSRNSKALVTNSDALVPSSVLAPNSKALVTNSFLLLLARHLLLHERRTFGASIS